MLSLKKIQDYMNEFCRVIDTSAKTSIDRADAELQIRAVAQCWHWIEFNEKTKKEMKKCAKKQK